MVRPTRFLHCNLNCADVAAAAALYTDALGLRTGMTTRTDKIDARPMGLDTATATIEARFTYDHRGGRRSPALELVEWNKPATTGETYSDPGAVGMQAVGFEVRSIAEAVASLRAAGGVARPSTLTTVGGDRLVAAVMLDIDGVGIELVESDVAASATFAYVRMNCADLHAATDWYEQIGFERRGPLLQAVWEQAAQSAEVQVQRIGLPGDSSFELQLTTARPVSGEAKAHAAANHRGLFRMALAVEDIHDAVGSVRAANIATSDPVWVPLPGTPLGGIWASFGCDPDGVMVEFVGLPVAQLEAR